MESSAFRILVDIDALFDTRMGTLITMSDRIADHLPIDVYRNRELDDFEKLTGGFIKNADYIERYSKRDYDVISNSRTTGIIPIICNYLDSLKERFFRGVDVSSINVDVNVYPYSIPGPILGTIKSCLEALLPPYVVIGLVNHRPDEMAPEWFKYRYNGWITYSFHPWLETHHESLLVNKLNSLAVILPRLFVEEPGERVVNEEDGNFKPEARHGQFEMVMEEFIHLEHIPVADFCFLLPGTYRMPEDVDPQSSSSS